jgi:tRNA dimethylallyltransferase
MPKTCIIICGPTASGKTATAIALAKKYNTAVISADSRQCFKELNIGVAKPSNEELQAVPHYFINSHTVFDDVNAGSFERYALEKLHYIFKENDVAIVCGGTGLYINALCYGQDAIPAIDAALRKQLHDLYDINGMGWLTEELGKRDNAFMQNGESQNPQRMLRALEVVMQTGNPILFYQKGAKKQRAFDIIKLAINIDREILYERINNRVDVMMENGLLEEVKGLTAFKQLNALQTVGYTELFGYLDGECDLKTAIDKIKQHTRNYAKRQLTWFKKDDALQWLTAHEIANFNI